MNISLSFNTSTHKYGNFLKFDFPIALYISYYLGLVSGAQTTTCFTKWAPLITSTHLAPCIVITILLTVFPKLYFTSQWPFYNYQSVLLNPFTFSTQSPNTPPLWQISSLYLSVCFNFVCLFLKFTIIFKTNKFFNF